MEREEAHAVLVDLGPVMLGQRNEFEELLDLALQQRRVAAGQQSAESRHRLRVTVVRTLLEAEPVHEPPATKALDEIVDGRERWVTGQLALHPIVLQRVAVPA